MATHRFETNDPCGLARRLIAEGKADRSDRLETLTYGRPSLNGGVGWFADHTVRETPAVGPVFVKWKPFPAERRHAGTALGDSED
jgi:hypothetical protein